MRISDWSSDVFSSDLFIEEKHAIARADVDLVIDDMKLDASGLAADGGTLPEVDLTIPAEPADTAVEMQQRRQAVSGMAGPADRVEIGRASGRERVCQYG